MKFAVIENELGDIAIDNQILALASEEQIVSVSNGCICCNIRGDLVASLQNMKEEITFTEAVLSR